MHTHERSLTTERAPFFLFFLFPSKNAHTHASFRPTTRSAPGLDGGKRRERSAPGNSGRRKAGKRIRPIGEPDYATLVRKCRVPAERAPKQSEWKAAAPTEQTSGPSRRPLAKSRRSAEKQVLARAFIRGLRCWRRLGLNIKKNPPQCRRKRVPLLCVCVDVFVCNALWRGS